MKKFLSICLILSLFTLVACAGNSQIPDSSTAGSSVPEEPAISIEGDILRMGNFEIAIPNGFKVTSSSENSASIAANDGDGCFIGVFAADVSALTEDKIKEFLPQQATSFSTDNAIRSNESQTDTKFGPLTVTLDLYAETSSDLNATINMDASFTDSWYTYTVMFRCYAGSDNISEYSTTFAEFCGYAKYTGKAARFNFVQ